VQGRPRGFDSDQVLDAAMAVFWKKGYAGTGLSELETATKLGRQSLYGAFGDKRALFASVVDRYFDVVLRPFIIDVLDAPGSGRANVERVIRDWEVAASAPDFNGCLVGNSSSEVNLHDPEMIDMLKRKLDLLEAAFHRALKRAQEAGEVKATLNVRSTARSLLVTAQGLSIVYRVNRDRAFVRAIVRDALARLDD